MELAHKAFLNTHSLCVTVLPDMISSSYAWSVSIPLTAILLRSSLALALNVPARRALVRRNYFKPMESISWNITHYVGQRDGKWMKPRPTVWLMLRDRKIRYLRNHFSYGLMRQLIAPLLSVPAIVVFGNTLRIMCGCSVLPISEIFATHENSWYKNWVVDQLSTGGILWFENLTLPDPTGCLSVALGVTLLAETKYLYGTSWQLWKTQGNEQQTRKVTRIIQRIAVLASILAIPISATLPSGVTLFWLSSVVTGFACTQLLRRILPVQFIQRACRYPYPLWRI